MKKIALIVSVVMLAATFSFAGDKTYQVTGPIVSMTDSTIVVQKGKDLWELNRNAATTTTGNLAVGQKVTIQYTMTATSIEVKETKATKAAATAKSTAAAVTTTATNAVKAAAGAVAK